MNICMYAYRCTSTSSYTSSPSIHPDTDAYICFAQGPCNKQGQNKTMQECYDKLNKICLDMEKASKLSTRVVETAKASPGAEKGTFKELIDKLADQLKTLDKTTADLQYLLKYKETREGGKPLTIPLAQEVSRMCARCLHDVVDSTKQTKSLLPAKAKPA